jgi:hypothetical protein
MRRHYSLVMMAFWLGIAAVALAPDGVLSEKVRAHIRGPGVSMVGMLALAFAAWNLVRWWAAGTVAGNRPRPNPLARRGDDDEPYVPNPELDFLRPPETDHEGNPVDGRTPPP